MIAVIRCYKGYEFTPILFSTREKANIFVINSINKLLNNVDDSSVDKQDANKILPILLNDPNNELLQELQEIVSDLCLNDWLNTQYEIHENLKMDLVEDPWW
jgi:hypothetical protein